MFTGSAKEKAATPLRINSVGPTGERWKQKFAAHQSTMALGGRKDANAGEEALNSSRGTGGGLPALSPQKQTPSKKQN